MIYQLRLYVAEIFLNWALSIMPKNAPETKMLARSLTLYLRDVMTMRAGDKVIEMLREGLKK